MSISLYKEFLIEEENFLKGLERNLKDQINRLKVEELSLLKLISGSDPSQYESYHESALSSHDLLPDDSPLFNTTQNILATTTAVKIDPVETDGQPYGTPLYPPVYPSNINTDNAMSSSRTSQHYSGFISSNTVTKREMFAHSATSVHLEEEEEMESSDNESGGLEVSFSEDLSQDKKPFTNESTLQQTPIADNSIQEASLDKCDTPISTSKSTLQDSSVDVTVIPTMPSTDERDSSTLHCLDMDDNRTTTTDSAAADKSNATLLQDYVKRNVICTTIADNEINNDVVVILPPLDLAVVAKDTNTQNVDIVQMEKDEVDVEEEEEEEEDEEEEEEQI